MKPRPIALLTDFGHRDPFVGICHGVILREDPTIPLIDIVHGIKRQDVAAGALALADAVPYMPADCVFVAVVDPGVGGTRRAVAVQTEDGSIFVGPDNGLLAPAIELRGGATNAYEISQTPWQLTPLSNTFHGRDIFMPVAAKLATGSPISESGEAIDPGELLRLPEPRVEWSGDAVSTSVIAVDEFGNVRLAGHFSDLGNIYRGDRLNVTAHGRSRPTRASSTYTDGDAGSLLLIEDSTGSLTLAINEGDAATELGVQTGDNVRISRQ
jgi:S-adenosylmethionine hydrolase